MARITISGHSDDIIMVDGDIQDELYPKDDLSDDGALVAISDGTVLRVKYDGIWRITPVTHGSAQYGKDENPEDDSDRYSDVVTLEGDVRWVVIGTSIAR